MQFAFENDCRGVHASLEQGADFILLDVRSPVFFARAHVLSCDQAKSSAGPGIETVGD